MQGLALSEAFFALARPLLEDEAPGFLERAAVGLAGEGSECFGFDDALSRDHDWGAAFCLWLPRAEWARWLEPVERALARLPDTFEGAPSRMRPEQRMGRCGPFSIERFFARFINLERPPQDWREWRDIPEHFLAVATNGRVFADPAGTFSAFRNALLAFYPEDVRLKKIAARCMTMAQAGQYNLPRSLARGEAGAALLCAARFCEAALSMTFLLNRCYMPFYKWARRGAMTLPVLGAATADCVQGLAGLVWTEIGAAQAAADLIEPLCEGVAAELRAQGLSAAAGNWLLAHGPEVQARIVGAELRAMPVMLE